MLRKPLSKCHKVSPTHLVLFKIPAAGMQIIRGWNASKSEMKCKHSSREMLAFQLWNTCIS